MSISVKELLEIMSLRLKNAENGLSHPSVELIADTRKLVSELKNLNESETVELEMPEPDKAIYRLTSTGRILCVVRS